MDETYIYWVDKSETDLTVDKATFFSVNQFTEASMLARMTITDFIRISATLPDPRGRIVYYTSPGRTGTILLSKILQSADSEGKTKTFASPTIFSTFGVMCTLNTMPHLSNQMRIKFMQTIFKFFCRSMTENQTYIFKVRSRGAHILGILNDALPGRGHYLFTCRKDIKAHLQSYEKIALSVQTRFDYWFFLIIAKKLPSLGCNLTGFFSPLVAGVKAYNLANYHQIVTAWALEPYAYYLKYKWLFNEFGELGPLRYEDMATDAHLPESQQRLQTAFRICGLDPNDAEAARLKATATDSQAGTAVSRAAIGGTTVYGTMVSRAAIGSTKVSQWEGEILETAKETTQKMGIPGEFWVKGVDILK